MKRLALALALLLILALRSEAQSIQMYIYGSVRPATNGVEVSLSRQTNTGWILVDTRTTQRYSTVAGEYRFGLWHQAGTYRLATNSGAHYINFTMREPADGETTVVSGPHVLTIDTTPVPITPSITATAKPTATPTVGAGQKVQIAVIVDDGANGIPVASWVQVGTEDGIYYSQQYAEDGWIVFEDVPRSAAYYSVFVSPRKPYTCGIGDMAWEADVDLSLGKPANIDCARRFASPPNYVTIRHHALGPAATPSITQSPAIPTQSPTNTPQPSATRTMTPQPTATVIVPTITQSPTTAPQIERICDAWIVYFSDGSSRVIERECVEIEHSLVITE